MNALRLIGRSLSSIVHRASFALMVIAGGMMIIMGLLVTQGVVRRYLFSSSEPYSYELTCYFLLTCMLLPAAYVTSVRRHIRADLLFNLFPRRLQSWLEGIIIPFIGLLFASVITWKSWEEAYRSFQISKKSIAVGMPVGAVQIIVPIALGMICLVLILQIAGYLASSIGNTEKPDDPG